MRPETFRPIPHRGEPHSFAISDLVSRTKANERLSPTDIQALVAFISSPKPGDSTDGEWEERVNGVLNLLRRQTQDFKMQDAREEGATSLASSGPASQGAAGPPRPTRSDRIDWGRVDGVLKEASRRLAGDAGAAADVRVSAVLACVDRQNAGTLPVLRSIATDPALAITLRKAAIHGRGSPGVMDCILARACNRCRRPHSARPLSAYPGSSSWRN